MSMLHRLDPVEFEQLVGRIFADLGYEVRVTKRSGDEGIDLQLQRVRNDRSRSASDIAERGYHYREMVERNEGNM